MRIAISITNVFRDLSGALLLIRELCQQGAICYLLLKSKESKHELLNLAPDFVLLPHLRRNRADFLKDILDCGIQLGVLDAEGGVLTSFDWYGEALVRDEELRRRVSCFCLWGPQLADHAVEQGWYTKSQVYVTGAPRFDFYAPEWREVSLPNAPSAQQFPRPLILINGRFSWANPIRRTPEVVAASVMKIRGYTPEQAQTMLACQQRGMNALVEMTNHLASRFPEITFVYRPHPFERFATYYDLLKLKEYPNLRLEQRGEIQNWLRLADGIIQRGCTTAIEAGMIGIPALSPDWIETAEPIKIVEDVSFHCADMGELEKCLEQVKNETFRLPAEVKAAHEEVVRNWFYATDGQAYKRVASAILDSYHKNRQSIGEVDIQDCRQLLLKLAQESSKCSKQTGLIKKVKSVLKSVNSVNANKNTTEDYLEIDLSKIQAFLDTLDGITLKNVSPITPSVSASWAGKDDCIVSGELPRGIVKFVAGKSNYSH